MIVVACVFLAASADRPMVYSGRHPMATLSHNGELSFFNDLYALERAIDAAENRDTIYLSEGEFIVRGGMLTITKRLSIVGNGYGSHILGNINFDLVYNFDSSGDAPLFDGVRMDNLSFRDPRGTGNNDYVKDHLGESEIRRCWINTLEDGGNAGHKVTIDKCLIENARFGWGTDNVLVKNSKLRGGGEDADDMDQITAINCNISNAWRFPRTMVSSILTLGRNEPDIKYPSSIINSVLEYMPSSSNLFSLDCYIHEDENQPLLDENMDCQLNLEELGFFGQDGTVVGIYGGESPFSENPSVPTIDSGKSSVEYDAENNRLKVKITVKAD